MAAGAIQKPTNLTKRITDADIDFDTDSFRLLLLTADPTSAINANDNWSAISGTEVANANGYTTHGFAMTTSTSTAAGTATFTVTGNQVLTATGAITVDWAAVVDTSIAGLTTEADATDIVVAFFEVNSGSDIVMSNGDTLTFTLADIYDVV